MVSVKMAKKHLRIDGDFDDAHLSFLVDAATEYVSSMTHVENNEDAPNTYHLCCLLLVAHWYQNREAVTQGSVNRLPYGVASLISQLSPVESE